MGLKITIVGGAGAIGLVHAWMLAASGHIVTILDSRPDGAVGDSFNKLLNAKEFCFRFLEMEQVLASLPEEGISADAFKEKFINFPQVFQSRMKADIALSNSHLSHNDCIKIIHDTIRLPKNSIHLAQASHDILEEQDIIVVTVKCAALTVELGHKIKNIRQKSETPVVIFANGIQPWIKPEFKFAGLRLSSLNAIYDFVDCIEINKVKAGVLIKYGAAIEGDGVFCVRSPFFNTRNIVANITNTDLTPDLQWLSEVYTQVGITTNATDTIQHIMLDKLNYNLTGSIMGAIFNYKMGELVNNEHTKKAVEACAIELYRLADKLKVSLAGSEIEFVNKTIDALQKNANVTGSPLQDIHAGRTTEKDFLIKATIELAQELDMPMPVLQAMYDLMGLVENKARNNIGQGRALQAQILQQIEHGDIVSIAIQYQPNKPPLSFFSASETKVDREVPGSSLPYKR